MTTIAHTSHNLLLTHDTVLEQNHSLLFFLNKTEDKSIAS